jgi:hypothetical protein
LGDREEMARYEARAEEAYSALYDAAPYLVKDFHDDSSFALARAIDLARKLGLDAEAERLAARKAHITAVYNNQFRYIGR